MTPFRQVILPGDVGPDVRAVKRAMRAMGIRGSGGLVVSDRAGSAFVDVLETVQRQHDLRADGKYGKATHAVVAPHFDLYGASLYRRAKIRDRTPPPPPIGQESAQAAARALLSLPGYRADNHGDRLDLERTAAGKPVWSALGRWVYVDARPLRLVHWLIAERNFSIGTFAICSDHHNDGPHGHAGGLAIDVSSIDGRSIGGSGSHDLTKEVATLIRTAPDVFRPRQLICAGSGGVYYADIEALCIPYASYYGRDLAAHRGHIHAGF